MAPIRATASAVAGIFTPCVPYKVWERNWFPGSTSRMCPMLAPLSETPNMPFSFPLASTSVVEMLVQGRCNGQAIVNRFYFRYTNSTSSPIPSTDLINAFASIWRAGFCAHLTADYVVDFYILKTIAAITGTPPRWVYEYQDIGIGTTTDAGAIAGEALPTYATMTVRWITGLLGRNWRGSSHLSPVPETYSRTGYPNYLDETLKETVRAAVSTMAGPNPLGGMNGSSSFVVASLTLAPNATSLIDPTQWNRWTAPVQGSVVNSRLGTQRSRHPSRASF